jgi:hypothetical protein
MEKKIGMSVQYDCTGMMESEQQEFQVKFKEEEEFEGGMSSDFFMNYMRKGIEDLIKRFPSHYKAVNNCFKHYEEEKKLDTVNMGNQMISFRGMEISMDDIMLMYDEFKAMMGKVSKKFLEPIELDKTLNIDIDESRKQEYFGAMSFVSNMLKAKGEDEPIRMLFQAWLMSKNDFVSLFKAIIKYSNIKSEVLNLKNLIMSFDGVDHMYEYDNTTKTISMIADNSDNYYSEAASKLSKHFKSSKNSKVSEIANLGYSSCSFDMLKKSFPRRAKIISDAIINAKLLLRVFDIDKELFNKVVA